jgi:hypothetical protein
MVTNLLVEFLLFAIFHFGLIDAGVPVPMNGTITIIAIG